MTSSDTTRTERVAKVTENLRSLVAGVESVLFDFDGPICRLFAGHRANDVADNLVTWLEEHGLAGLLTEEERLSGDPHVVLRAVGRSHPDSDLVTDLEARLTREELRAAATAYPTPYVDRLIQTWSAMGVGLAVASNNSPQVVESYLRSRRLTACFNGGIHGRTDRLRLLKPDPDCLHRALESLGMPAATSLMIGDTPADLYAAREAGIAFLGYGRDERREKRLRTAGAELVVSSLGPVVDLVWRQAQV
ncbi:HAD-IA family hydrolase [Streptomyces sp. E11-3]|uniref:HAD family hydrolase n=1 Tax=Streptomyces sp. E11-3 TaxID=3110112 RepID=UPI003980A465